MAQRMFAEKEETQSTPFGSQRHKDEQAESGQRLLDSLVFIFQIYNLIRGYFGKEGSAGFPCIGTA